jgi:hypothetical protein
LRASKPPLALPPFLPPALVLSDFLLPVCGQVGAGFRDGMQLRQAYTGAEFVDALRLGERPGSSPAVARLV